MLVPAPFPLPPGFLDAVGYRGGRRLVAVWWEACGDESGCDDGAWGGCGLTDGHRLLAFLRRPDVAAWLAGCGLHLGNSDEPARDRLVFDAVAGAVYAGPRREARQAVVRQAVPVG